jgi:hypothetical protein
MDYQNQYNKLIESAVVSPSPGYTEIHHIVPRCMGGSNEPSNLVRLSAKQHFVAHHLLFKIHKSSRMAHAWYSMCRIGRGQEERKVNAKYFNKAKVARSKLLSASSMGANNHFYGKTHSTEARQIMSKKQSEMRLWERRSDAHEAALLASQKKPKTEEHKSKIGRKGMVMLQNIHTQRIVRVEQDDQQYQTAEWINPKKLKPERKYKCDHCDIVTIAANLKRWHNDNCPNLRKSR